MSKTCTKCGETKPLDDFHRNKGRVDGRRSHCKECVREYDRRYHEENRDELRERSRRYYEENRDKQREYKRRYREENREKEREYKRRYYEGNRDERREYSRRYHEENLEKVRERNLRYYEENRDILNQGKKMHYAQNARASTLLADRKGVPYSPEEDALILADNGMTNYQKAIELGRPYQSVTGRKQHLRARANH